MNDYYFYTDQMTVGYDGKPLIREIELGLRRGEILTLIGPNGAGKSTILKSITRQLKLIGGTVWLDGKDMLKLSGKEVARRLAVVLTERLKPELMSCEDVVATGRYPYTGSLGILEKEDHEKIEHALELVHALDLRNRDFTTISDGQRQRILLARAICQEPEMIILDEPTSFLDVKHKLEFLTLLKEMVREQNVAVVMSLHELDLAQKISDKVICVKGEWVERYGTPEEIFTSAYIRSLYQMQEGSYDADFGCMELPAAKGKPDLFVIAGGGSGIALFRKLQRQQIPFVTGILHENDIDCKAAGYLACEVIRQKAFELIDKDSWQFAKKRIDECSRTVCCLSEFGMLNEKNRELMEYAQQTGKLCDLSVLDKERGAE